MSLRTRWLAACVPLLVAGCGDDATGPEPLRGLPPGASLTVAPEATEIGVGRTVQLLAVALTEAGDTLRNLAVTWASSDPDVAVVDSSGRVTGIGPGSAEITAALENASATADIDVEFPLMSVSAGGAHSCGLTPDRDAFCWGDNRSGQLGAGNAGEPAVPAPTRVLGGLEFGSISAGSEHTCALTPGQAAYCWGANGSGQLGFGLGEDAGTPVEVAGGLPFTAISAGGAHSCGLTPLGAIHCWGDNSYGQLGDGTREASRSPVRVTLDATFTAVSAGESHTCGRTDEGHVYCWGDNEFGQLGTGDVGGFEGEPGFVGGGFDSVSAGDRHTCGLVRISLYCWGDNSVGQLGVGATSGPRLPTEIGDPSLRAVSAGGDHSCGLTWRGIFVVCWGANEVGELGLGMSDPVVNPTIVSEEMSFRVVDAGDSHTCAVGEDGFAYCWGRNDHGQLGDGTREDRSTPVRLSLVPAR